MSGAPEGSVARPYRQSLFSRITEVHWITGAAVIVEVVAPETKFYDVATLTPPGEFFDSFSGATVAPADYAEHFGLNHGIVGSAGTVIVQDELTDVWIWDGFLHMGTLDDPGDVAAAVAAGNATFGYASNLHLTGQQVKRNRTNPAGGPYLFGEVVEHTHPNGTSVAYRSGYIAMNEGPQYIDDQPVGNVSYATTDAYYWYRVTTVPEQTAAILRKSYLVNIKQGWTLLAELRDYASALAHPTQWSIKGYPHGTSFTVADGVMAPVGGVAPRFQASGSEAGGHDGTIRKFNGSGFVA